MKILFIFSTPGGGMQTLNTERNTVLSKKGIECHFLYFKTGNHLETPNNHNQFFTNINKEIKMILHDHQYQAIVVSTYFDFLERIRSLGYDGKVIYELQGLGSYQTTINWIKKSKTHVLKNADAVMYPKTKFLDELIKEHYQNKPLFSFNNCIDSQLFSYIDVPKPKHTIMGWVGRLDSNKNWKEFLLIGASLSKIIPNLQLWIICLSDFSSKKEQKHLSRWINKLDLSEKLVVYENVKRESMPRFYSLMAKSGGLLCSTSKLEGFGYAVMEAMSCSCPVLATRSGGVENFVYQNVTGKLYDLGRIDNAENEAKELILNTKLRNDIILRANQIVRTSYGHEQYSQNFTRMLEQLLN